MKNEKINVVYYYSNINKKYEFDKQYINFDDTVIYINNVDFKETIIAGNSINDSQLNQQIVIHNIANKKNIIFENCIFEKELKFETILSYNVEFIDCKFDNIIFSNLKKEIIRDDGANIYNIEFNFNETSTINRINIRESNFSGRFYINNQNVRHEQIRINSVDVYNSKFSNNFKLHNCKIKEIDIDGVDFEKNADFFMSELGVESKYDKGNIIVFESINFKKLVIFEECIFYNKFILQYATFESLVQFREATFKWGLDLDKTNILNNLNFYGIKELEKANSKEETSQETYKIVKYYSEKNGSVIEANKYHALELEKKRKELYFWSNFYFWKKKDENRQYNKLDWLVFNGNYITSKFGTNWGLAFLWILATGFLTSMFMKTGNYYSFEYIFEYVNKWELFKEILADTPKYMSIINGDELKKYSVAFLLNKVLLGYLYYQFVTAVRKDTRK